MMTDQAFHLVSALAAGALVSAVWQGAVLVLAVAILLRLLPAVSAAARSIVWSTVLLLLLGLHFGVFFRGGSGAGAASPVHVDFRWSLLLAGVWIGLSLWRLGQIVWSAVSLRGIARRSTLISDTGLSFADPTFSQSVRRAGPPILMADRGEASPSLYAARFVQDGKSLFRDAAVYASSEVERPCVVGFFSPRVLLPADLAGKLSASDTAQIVLHEMEHLRRRDNWTNLLQKLALALFPLNPVVAWVERRLCVERELACDDHVLRATRARKAYAACLANLAENSILRRGASLALGAWEKQSELARRVHRILGGSEHLIGARKVKAVSAALIAAVVGGASALARAPQLVSFLPAVPVASVASVAPVVSGPKMMDVVYREPVARPHVVIPIARSAQNGAPMLAAYTEKADSSRSAQEDKSLMNANAALKNTKGVRKAQRRRAEVPNISQRARKNGEPFFVARSEAASWIVLTSWNVDEAAPPNITPASYAAVPTPDGWLIVQL